MVRNKREGRNKEGTIGIDVIPGSFISDLLRLRSNKVHINLSALGGDFVFTHW